MPSLSLIASTLALVEASSKGSSSGLFSSPRTGIQTLATAYAIDGTSDPCFILNTPFGWEGTGKNGKCNYSYAMINTGLANTKKSEDWILGYELLNGTANCHNRFGFATVMSCINGTITANSSEFSSPLRAQISQSHASLHDNDNEGFELIC